MHIMGYSLAESSATINVALFAGVINPLTVWEIVIDGFEWPKRTTDVFAYTYWERGKPRLGAGSHGELIRIGNGRPDLGIAPVQE